MIFFIVLIFSAYVVLTTTLFYAKFAEDIYRNTGEVCSFKKDEISLNIIARILKTPYIKVISKWLYALFLMHLLACASLMVSIILFKVYYFQQLRLVLVVTMVVEVVSFIPTSINLEKGKK